MSETPDPTVHPPDKQYLNRAWQETFARKADEWWHDANPDGPLCWREERRRSAAANEPAASSKETP